MAAAGALAARSFAISTLLLVILIHSGQALESQSGETAAVNLPIPEDSKSSIIVNQQALLQIIREISKTLNGMVEREARRDEEEAARDARLHEMGKDLRAIIENGTQEMLQGMASLREELVTKVPSPEQDLVTKVPSPEQELVTNVTSPACPDGWLCHESSLYLLDHTTRTWEDSLAYCRDRGGDLVKITSEEEEAFIIGYLGERNYWIGLNDRVTEGRFVWTDGTTPTYTRWGVEQPRDGYAAEDCVYMRRDYDHKWYDGICSPTGRSVVCERPVHA